MPQTCSAGAAGLHLVKLQPFSSRGRASQQTDTVAQNAALKAVTFPKGWAWGLLMLWGSSNFRASWPFGGRLYPEARPSYTYIHTYLQTCVHAYILVHTYTNLHMYVQIMSVCFSLSLPLLLSVGPVGRSVCRSVCLAVCLVALALALSLSLSLPPFFFSLSLSLSLFLSLPLSLSLSLSLSRSLSLSLCLSLSLSLSLSLPLPPHLHLAISLGFLLSIFCFLHRQHRKSWQSQSSLVESSHSKAGKTSI